MTKRPRQIQPHPKPRRRRIFLKEWRQYRNLTQEALAERVGWSVGNVSQLERGQQGYSDEGLAALADALNCTPGQILDVDPTKTDAIWSIWETAKQAERQDITDYARYVIEKRLKTGT